MNSVFGQDKAWAELPESLLLVSCESAKLLFEDRTMRILKEKVPFDEIRRRYDEEHRGWKGYSIGLDYLTTANERCQGRWTLVLLSGADIANVMLPWHKHEIEVIPPTGLSVAEAAQRLKQLPKDQMPDC
jgi:hypothetical protein